MVDHVVLLHGIWMRPFTLALIARRLRASGYAVTCIGYASVTRAPDACLGGIAERIAALPAARVHLVGHSLGGLLALALARDGCTRSGGRVVCLGTPMHGSAVARVLAAHRTLRWSLGHAAPWLCSGAPCWPDGTQVGMVAGALPFGFGAFVPGLARPHDGTVAVDETRDARLAGHVVLRTSHSGLLLSARAAELARCFLAEGRFPAPAESGHATGAYEVH